MKKLILGLFIVLSISQVKASDTLTVRQVFNFNVGDTFDYVIVNYPGFGSPSYDFYKTEIINKWYTLSQDTLYYIRSSHYLPNGPPYIDTIAYSNLDSLLPLNDTPQNCNNCNMHLLIDSACNTVRNQIAWGNGLYGVVYTYIEGLGKAQSSVSGDDGSGTDTSLTAYIINGVYNHTPYFTTGINDITNLPNIHLYPNPTTDQIHLSTTNTNQSNTKLVLTDIIGQEVYTASITQKESAHDISKLSSGMYTWSIISDNGIIKTGKIIKE